MALTYIDGLEKELERNDTDSVEFQDQYKERLKSDPNIQAALKERLRGKTNIFLLEHNIFVCRNCCTTDKEFTLQPSQSGLQSPPASEVSSIRSLSCL